MTDQHSLNRQNKQELQKVRNTQTVEITADTAAGTRKHAVPRMKTAAAGLLAFVLVLALAFAGCSRAHKADMWDEPYGNNGFKPGEGAANSSEQSGDGLAQTGEYSEKLIKEVTLYGETKEFDRARADILALVKSLGGYIGNSETTGGTRENEGYYVKKTAYMEVRVPAEQLDTFVNTIGESVNVYSSSEKVLDVTETYYDIKARMDTLIARRAALEEMYAKAEDLNSLLAIQEKLYSTIAEIESYQARLNVMDNKVAYSTVYLRLYEVGEYTPQDESFGERISRSFRSGWERFGEGCQEFAVWFVGALPGLLIFAGIVAATVFIIRGIVRKKRAKRAEARRVAEAKLNGVQQ